VWRPDQGQRVIINLPATVEVSTPNVFADQVETVNDNIRYREHVLISVHTHDDRGCGVAAAELAVMAGADRVEGTLLGNGERTGNMDLVTAGMNLYAQGIDPEIDFSRMKEIIALVEEITEIQTHPRHPYAGDLVFTAFSGSHQDAIKKGFDRRSKEVGESDEEVAWGVPYLTIDPKDIGRSYEAIIRINSQSGKGGVAYVLDREHGFDLPKSMHPQVGKFVYDKADAAGRELSNEEIGELFFEKFVNIESPLSLEQFELDHTAGGVGEVLCHATVKIGGEEVKGIGKGNGPINAFVHFLGEVGRKDFAVTDYRSQALRGGSDADSAAYVQVKHAGNGTLLWGCGIDSSIEMAGLKALICAWNLLRDSEE